MLTVTQHAMAQRDSTKMEETSVATHEGISVTISVDDLSELQGYKAKYNDLLTKYDTLKSKYDSLDIAHRKEVTELTILRQQSSKEKNCIQSLKEELGTTNKKLINMAANFLFIPYEAYGIEKIAIPAFVLLQAPNSKRNIA